MESSRQIVQHFDAVQRSNAPAVSRFDVVIRRQVSKCTLWFLLIATCLTARADSTLAVVRAGIQQSEDAPFVPADFRFLPGDFVYLTFDVAGFATKADKNAGTRHLSLAYEITGQDARDVALAEPVKGTVEDDLNPEDKNWTPKRRASFLLPSYVAAGEYHVHVAVRDLIGKQNTAADLPFLIGGIEIKNSESIAAGSFSFFRKENEREKLDLPAYAPGDTVFAHFNITGFKLASNNEYDVSYGVTVLRPDGKPFLNDPHAAELKDQSFYPARYLPGSLAITVPPTASHGQYVLTVTVRDLIGKQSYQLKQSFSIE